MLAGGVWGSFTTFGLACGPWMLGALTVLEEGLVEEGQDSSRGLRKDLDESGGPRGCSCLNPPQQPELVIVVCLQV